MPVPQAGKIPRKRSVLVLAPEFVGQFLQFLLLALFGTGRGLLCLTCFGVFLEAFAQQFAGMAAVFVGYRVGFAGIEVEANAGLFHRLQVAGRLRMLAHGQAQGLFAQIGHLRQNLAIDTDGQGAEVGKNREACLQVLEDGTGIDGLGGSGILFGSHGAFGCSAERKGELYGNFGYRRQSQGRVLASDSGLA